MRSCFRDHLLSLFLYLERPVLNNKNEPLKESIHIQAQACCSSFIVIISKWQKRILKVFELLSSTFVHEVWNCLIQVVPFSWNSLLCVKESFHLCVFWNAARAIKGRGKGEDVGVAGRNEGRKAGRKEENWWQLLCARWRVVAVKVHPVCTYSSVCVCVCVQWGAIIG